MSNDTPMKSVTPTAQHIAFRKALEEAIAKHGTTIDATDLLAILSHMVGQVIAMQDQRIYTPEVVMALVSSNIAQGNKEAFDSLMKSEGTMQ